MYPTENERKLPLRTCLRPIPAARPTSLSHYWLPNTDDHFGRSCFTLGFRVEHRKNIRLLSKLGTRNYYCKYNFREAAICSYMMSSWLKNRTRKRTKYKFTLKTLMFLTWSAQITKRTTKISPQYYHLNKYLIIR